MFNIKLMKQWARAINSIIIKTITNPNARAKKYFKIVRIGAKTSIHLNFDL